MGLPRIFLYVVGRIMTALIAGFGLAWDYTGESVLTISSDNWGLIGLIAFGVFALITIFREVDLVIQQRPKIQVKPITNSDNKAVLEIHNEGGDANFTAKAIVVKGVPPKTRYAMCWDSPPHLEHLIKKGDTSTIMVAEKESVTTQSPSAVPGGLVLHKWGTSGVEKMPATTEELRERVMLNERYPSMKQPVDDTCTIEVTITSTPSLLTSFDNHKYVVKIDHEQGHELLFLPLS